MATAQLLHKAIMLQADTSEGIQITSRARRFQDQQIMEPVVQLAKTCLQP